MAGLPIVTVPHPVTHLDQGGTEKLVESALEEIVHVLSSPEGQLAEEYRKKNAAPRGVFQTRPLFTAGRGEKEKVAVADSLEAINNLFISGAGPMDCRWFPRRRSVWSACWSTLTGTRRIWSL